MKDLHLSLDRLERHVTEAISKLDHKIKYHSYRGDRESMARVADLVDQRKALAKRYAEESARITARIQAEANPPPIRRPSRPPKQERRRW